MWTPTLSRSPGPPRAARPRGPRRRRAACPPSAPRESGTTAPGRAGAPGNSPDPAPMTVRCPWWSTRPHAPPCAGMARGSVNIQEAVYRVAHTGRAEVALHTRAATTERGRGSSWSPREWFWS